MNSKYKVGETIYGCITTKNNVYAVKGVIDKVATIGTTSDYVYIVSGKANINYSIRQSDAFANVDQVAEALLKGLHAL